MAHKAPGKSHRKGISLIEIMRKFPDDATAEAWFLERRWPSGIACPHCGSANVQTGAKHKTMPFRCREKECAKRFSAKTGTVMELRDPLIFCFRIDAQLIEHAYRSKFLAMLPSADVGV